MKKQLVQPAEAGMRLDTFIASHFPANSRSQACKSIRHGMIKVNGNTAKPAYRVSAGETIQGSILPAKQIRIEPEAMALLTLYEDSDIIVINKQPGIVIHPAVGHYSGTLVNGLLYCYPEIKNVGDDLRPGIVHRLDKDTSGVIVVARNEASLEVLAGQFKQRKVKKEYLALVYGEPQVESGTIKLPIGRHPSNRKKMSTRSKPPKKNQIMSRIRPAETHWQVVERFHGASFLRLDLKTGRTHQARVHCAAIHHPVIADTVYGKTKLKERLLKDKRSDDDSKHVLRLTSRQMLHARRISFTHPQTKKNVTFECPLPEDMRKLLTVLKANAER
ncbi:RluA family pseudouridine synthase [Desulfococcaceae bacterium HSG9]|nr:RluA family pseudouridine synthase [Desulfococcaceae bacterium HSG9]